MNSKAYQNDTPLIPFKKLYDVFKSVEEMLKEHLDELEHEYFPIGLRVAYDEEQSFNEPGVMHDKVEFGYLGPVDAAAKCMEEEEQNAENLEKAEANVPITISFLDELYNHAKEELEGIAGKDLRVSVDLLIMGSPALGYSVSCPCPNKKKRYCYYDRRTKRTRCYCTDRGC